jgi:hypothetical protein
MQSQNDNSFTPLHESVVPDMKSAKTSSALGILFFIQFVGVYVLDWWYPVSPDSTSARFLPHFLRAALVLQIGIYTAIHARQAASLRVVKFQFLWLGILTLRFLFYGNFDSQVVLYMSYYAYWAFVLWAAYCLVANGRLTARQVAIAGMSMNVLIMLRNALFTVFGIWVGDTGGMSESAGQVVNSSYLMLWFTLMQMLDTSVPMTGPIALLGVASIVLTMKRGAFIALLLALLVYGITYAYIHRKERGIQRVAIIATGTAALLGALVMSHAGDIADRWSDLDNPNIAGSGREVFWQIIAQHWLDAGLVTKLIGFGPHSTYDYTGLMWFAEVPAHNDWLNLLHEFGIVGVLAFAGVCWALGSSVPRLIRDCPHVAPAYCASLAVGFCMTLFDLFSYTTDTAWFSLIVAVSLGLSARAHRVSGENPIVRKSACRRLAMQIPAESR